MLNAGVCARPHCSSCVYLVESVYVCRRGVLLERSALWVDPATLDERIDRALDNPVPLA